MLAMSGGLVVMALGLSGMVVWNWVLRRELTRRSLVLKKESEDNARTKHTLKEIEVILRRAQKMETIGCLAGGVAHDFNNILTIILNYGMALRERLTRRGVPCEEVDEILATSERAARLTRQLLAFSRTSSTQVVPIDVGAVVRDVAAMLQRLVGAQVRLETTVPDHAVVVMAESTQIEQILLNLAANARDAMPNGGTLSIRVASGMLESTNRWDLAPGSYATIVVGDDGTGMDDEILAHIFEPFFTTKQSGKGTGLGLAMVLANVTKLGGKVSVDSRLGHGASFVIVLPEASLAESREPGSVSVLSPVRSPETILLVEDDHVLRRAAKLALVRAGHTVLEAKDGEEAERMGRAGEPFTVLVTDVVVPKKSGPSLADALRAVRPGLRVLFVSGYALDANSLDLTVAGTAFLAKPYTGAMLAAAVRRLARDSASSAPTSTSSNPMGTASAVSGEQRAVPPEGGADSHIVPVARADVRVASATVALGGEEGGGDVARSSESIRAARDQVARGD